MSNDNTHTSNQKSRVAFFSGTPQDYVLSAILILLIIAFILGSRLAVAGISYDTTKKSLAQAAFGDARMALSAKLYTEADVYFHRGVPHIHKHAFSSDIFQQAREKVSPSKHVHVHGSSGIKEIMPWLDLSIRANPQNLESYLVAAFWLAGEANRKDLALDLLIKAQRNIPFSYQVQMEKGRLLLHMGKHNEALQAFNAALAFWNKTANKKDHQALLDKAQILLYRGLLLEECGKIKAAISDFTDLRHISPESPQMNKRLSDLQAGHLPETSAHDLLASVLKKEDKHRRECKHHHHHDDDD